MDHPPLTDSHCHLASRQFVGEVDAVTARARAAGVTRMITLSTGFDDIPANIQIAASRPGVSATVGIHPCDAHTIDSTDTGWPERLTAMAADPSVAAIGEPGLDYSPPAPDGWDQDTFRAHQRSLLRTHFEVAAATGLGIVLHTRDRSGHQSVLDALDIARDYAGRVRPLFHCFLGPPELLTPILALDGLVSFGGIITFPSAAIPRDTAVTAPAGTFLVETDAPYLAPVPHRGQRNEPAHVRHTATFLAAQRSESLESLAAHTNRTAGEFFRIDG